MSSLSKAIAIAATAHDGQFDKAGADYILHPLRVMMKMKETEEKIVAVLHDVLEDTNITENILYQNGFSEHVVEAIKSLSRFKNESYGEFIARVSKNKLATSVKIQDLIDNMDESRLKTIAEEDVKRNKKYEKALRQLRNVVWDDLIDEFLET